MVPVRRRIRLVLSAEFVSLVLVVSGCGQNRATYQVIAGSTDATLCARLVTGDGREEPRCWPLDTSSASGSTYIVGECLNVYYDDGGTEAKVSRVTPADCPPGVGPGTSPSPWR